MNTRYTLTVVFATILASFALGCGSGGAETHACDTSGLSGEKVTFALPNLDPETVANAEIIDDIECANGMHFISATHVGGFVGPDRTVTAQCREYMGESALGSDTICRNRKSAFVSETLTFVY